MKIVKCITFSKEAQDNLPQHIKDKMKANMDRARGEKKTFSGSHDRQCSNCSHFWEKNTHKPEHGQCTFSESVYYKRVVYYTNYCDLFEPNL